MYVGNIRMCAYIYGYIYGYIYVDINVAIWKIILTLHTGISALAQNYQIFSISSI
jgi:hypothetical protein